MAKGHLTPTLTAEALRTTKRAGPATPTPTAVRPPARLVTAQPTPDHNGATAYHPPDSYYGYHPPTTVYAYHPPAPYYPGCYDCGSTAGAVAVGAAVGVATGAAIASRQPHQMQPPRRTLTPRATTPARSIPRMLRRERQHSRCQRQCCSCKRQHGRCNRTGTYSIGTDCVRPSRGLHHAQRRKRHILPVRQYLVQPVVRIGWRVLQGGTDTIVRKQETFRPFN